MTERELRKKVVDIITGWVGAKRGDAVHKHIVDTYNAYKPVPRGARMSYTMDWCAATVSAVGILAGLTDIMPVECSCGELIKLYKSIGRWVENDAHIPMPGDLILYAWSDTGVGDCTKSPNHIGMVTEVTGSTISVVEGNMGTESRVGIRKININGRYIRGFCCPDYAAKVKTPEKEKEKESMNLYRYVAEMPKWAQPAATKAVNNGYIKMNEDGSVGVWEVNLQPLVWMDRAGMLDKPAINN